MTFYALLTVRKESAGVDGDGLPIEKWKHEQRALTEAEATAMRGALRIDVSSIGNEPEGPEGPDQLVFFGPKPPTLEPDWDFTDFNNPDHMGGVSTSQRYSSIGYPWFSPRETIEFSVYFDNWPPEYPRGAFIVEYEASAEMLYADESFYGDPYLFIWSDEGSTRIAMESRTEAGLGVYSFKVYTLGNGEVKPPSTLLLRLTIDPGSDSTRLESYYAHPIVAPWVAQWPELAAYPGNFSPLSFLFEPSAHAYFAMPITIEMIKFPPEGPPPGATLNDYLYLEADMLPDFPPLNRNNYGIQDDGGGAASYYAILPTWEFDPDPRIERPTVREVRIFAVGEFDEPTEFWAGRIGTVEKL